MKKTLLASAIALTFLGFATHPALAEENNVKTTAEAGVVANPRKVRVMALAKSVFFTCLISYFF